MYKVIDTITPEDIAELRQLSPASLPKNPTSSGMTETQIKERMVSYVIADSPRSIVGHINRIISDVNQTLSDYDAIVQSTSETVESLKNTLYDFGSLEEEPTAELRIRRGNIALASDATYSTGTIFTNNNRFYFVGTNGEEETGTPVRVLDTVDLVQLSNKIEQRQIGKFFDTKADMDTWLLDPENRATIYVGFNFYIKSVDAKVDHYSWDGTQAVELGEHILDCYTKDETDAKIADALDATLKTIVGGSY